MENKRQPVELATIFANNADVFLNDSKFTSVQKNAYRAIVNCRTIKLGGHQQQCNQCTHQQQAYNSCRNRHCPKCQHVKKAKWVDQLSGNLPQVNYFHLVFTIPECLNGLFYKHQRLAYDLLFKAASKSLEEVGNNSQYLGAKTGAVAILHTWGQSLVYHPHLHFIVPAGGLNEDTTEWIPAHSKFLVPVKIVSAVFRAMLCKLIENEIKLGTIGLPKNYSTYYELKTACYKTAWVVYCEKPFANPQNLIQYLGNYTHRVAISNQRIKSYKNGKVTFGIKDYKAGGIKKEITLEEEEFIRRYLQHILPKGYRKIRYFGFLSLGQLRSQVDLCNQLLYKVTFFPSLPGLNAYEVYRNLFKREPNCCPKCKTGRLQTVGKLVLLPP